MSNSKEASVIHEERNYLPQVISVDRKLNSARGRVDLSRKFGDMDGSLRSAIAFQPRTSEKY